ncbi:MAG: conjugative transposon protein TraM [Paludibacteraceae bacterium]|nr:conjugative transposon protein TraM [Paludibacteraceae bacterium]
MKISRKQMMVHVYSLFALVLVTVLFFILGGGSGDKAEGHSDSVLNTSVPLATEQTISSDRFTAQRREEQRLQDYNRVESLQRNSFDFFNSDSNSPNSTSSAQVQNSSASGEKFSIVKQGKTKTAHKGGARNDKGSVKDSIMRLKRAQLEKELGINLSDYGYDKYTEETHIDTEDEEDRAEAGGFYGLDSESDMFERDVRAVVHGSHENMTSGSIIKMRLIDDMEIDGVKIPMNTFVFGKLSFKSGRAMIRIQSINFHNRIIKFKGVVYDTDGFEGIYVPDNIISDTKDKAASDAIGGVNLNVSSKSKILNSAISAVGNAVKGAVSGSIRESKISISSNYMITIKRKK